MKTILWLMLCVACFFAGLQLDREWKRVRSRPTGPIRKPIYGPPLQAPQSKDGTKLLTPEDERKKPSPFRLTTTSRSVAAIGTRETAALLNDR